jgi:NADPH-dependent 2,4-dienoyl-CoA reductase/sulfur reductase-like enzyme
MIHIVVTGEQGCYMTERRSYIVIGNGIAGITAAETLRNEDASAEITVIGEHSLPVYTRPSLKDYLAGRVREENLYARRRSFYTDHRVHFVFDRAASIDVDAHVVHLRSGRRLNYDRLLLATGARARRLTCPGAGLASVFALRTIADFQSVLQALETARRVVVVGAGPVALETVEILHHRAFQVTHLLRGRRAWPGVLDATASNLVLQQERREGVDVCAEEEIVEIVGKQGRVVGVITAHGARIPCDIVLAAIGAEPVIDFISASGIPCGRGVRVDHTMRTGAPDVFAAGDVAEVIDTITGQPRCIGQWYPAIQQGRTAAYAMLDLLAVRHLLQAVTHSSAYLRSITATYLFGFDIAAVGITTPTALAAFAAPAAPATLTPDYQEIFADPGTHLYSKALLKDGTLIGALSFDGRRDMLAFKRAIDHAVPLAPVASCLFAADFKLAKWLDAQKVPTPVLAVRKARPGDNSPGRSTPARAMKNQFAPHMAFAARLAAQAGTTRLRANGDPYTMPIVTVPARGSSMPAPDPGEHPAASEAVAFLAPVLPPETARALMTAMPDRNSDDPYRLSLAGDTAAPGRADPSSLAPAWSYTRLAPGETVTIGRDHHSTLVLDHATVSRRHAEISYDNGSYLLRDLGSKNGTFINGELLEPRIARALQPRDQLRIGTLLTYMFDVRPLPPDVVGCMK